ncbi:hypothetical protein E2C01_032163 [Portunus trituberculatus]|uniref:Uncharacterized protein n=1 Tax=Portunus trituberculatus TaxID=210409 RepID=A0A5B7EWT3_PORTR|nr:hypothetical protein [Portunus trituberculatus]
MLFLAPTFPPPPASSRPSPSPPPHHLSRIHYSTTTSYHHYRYNHQYDHTPVSHIVHRQLHLRSLLRVETQAPNIGEAEPRPLGGCMSGCDSSRATHPQPARHPAAPVPEGPQPAPALQEAEVTAGLTPAE